MRWHWCVVGATALAWLAFAACDLSGAPPLPNPSAISLQAGDLPADFQRCPASGDIDRYLTALQRSNPAARDELAPAWRDLQRHGASVAAIAMVVQQLAACGGRVGTGPGASATTLVVRFRSEEMASAAYERGMLGFNTPNADEDVPDMARGIATGVVGRNAWVLERSVDGRSLLVGLWQRHTIAVLFVAVDVDPLHAKQAIAAVDRRIP